MEDLLALLRQWRDDINKLVVCIDANEDVNKKSIGKAFTDMVGLAMVEVVREFTGQRIGPMYFWGLKPINAVWATSNVQVVGASIMPACYGVGDHRLFVFDFVGSSLLGNAPKKIVCPQARQLNYKLVKLVEKYKCCLEEKILKHQLIEWTGHVCTSGLRGEEAKARLDTINSESKQYMKYAKKKCRQIKLGHLFFS